MPVTIHTKKVTAPREQRPRTTLDLERLVTRLRKEPGAWFEIRRYSGTQAEKQGAYVYAYNCKTGKNRALSPANGIEVYAAADRATNTVVVYARSVDGTTTD